MRTILTDAAAELATDRFKTWAAAHPIDANKVRLELEGTRRPTPGSPYARLLIEAIRVGRNAAAPAPAEPPAPPAPKPTTSLATLAQRVLFTAWKPEAALRAPTRYTVALSADPAFDAAARAAAARLKERGHTIAVWGVQTQIGVARIRELGAAIDADFLIFQAEVPVEYDTAIEAGATIIVGNPNAWTDAQRADATARIARGELAVIFEVYSNEGAPWPDRANGRVPAASELLGVGWGKYPYQLRDYLPHTPSGVWQTLGVYLAETMDDDSWARLP